MTARQLRRAKEHKERKLARKAALAADATTSAAEQNPSPASSNSQARLEANRANAQLSTGPTTEEGKAIAALNSLRHGFNGVFCVLPSESSKAFVRLVDNLFKEHQPATSTEQLLVTDMARHYWLTQRAIRLQEEALANHLDDGILAKQLALYMRYQTTNQRAFHRCLQDFLKLRKQRLTSSPGFISQKPGHERTEPESPEEQPVNHQRNEIEPIGFVSQNQPDHVVKDDCSRLHDSLLTLNPNSKETGSPSQI